MAFIGRSCISRSDLKDDFINDLIHSRDMTRKIMGLLIVFLLMGCVNPAPIQEPLEVKDSFRVHLVWSSSTSSGDRHLSVIYTVKNGVITSCEGQYSYPPSSEDRLKGNWSNGVRPCTVEDVINRRYGAPVFVTRPENTSGEWSSPPYYSRWKILEEQ